MRKALSSLCTICLLLVAVPYGFSSTETTRHNFTGGADGADPLGDLLYDSTTGVVFGTTNKGGGSAACTKGCGTVFSLRPDGSSYAVLYTFLGGLDGANPQAGLVEDAAGNLYGTTYNGGTHNLGTVFKLTSLGGGQYQESVLFSFSGSNGSHPQSRLVRDSFGNLYGTTLSGGAHGRGTVFVMPPSGGESVLYSFSGPDGSKPRAGVVLDVNHNLWGTTSQGGVANMGVVFRLSLTGSTWSETFAHSFTGPDGASPYAAVTLDNSGDVFGTTKTGGSPVCPFTAAGCGVVFELQPNGTGFIESSAYNFSGGPDGAAPIADLTFAQDASGNPYLYGTASQAGNIGGTCPAVGCGTAFELCGPGSSCEGPTTWTEYTLFDFLGKNGGRTPSAGMVVFQPVGAMADGFNFPPPGKGQCTSGCLTPASSGGTSGNGTVVQLNN